MSARDELACGAEAADLSPPAIGSGCPAEHAVAASLQALTVGELVAIANCGRTPLVTFRGQPGNEPMAAQSVVDLHGAHVGRRIVLLFEGGDPARPIVMGVLRCDGAWPLPERPADVAVEADGERLVVSAREQLVLRCGEASITLTKAGKVLIRGTYVLSRSSGVNRVKGGAVQLN